MSVDDLIYKIKPGDLVQCFVDKSCGLPFGFGIVLQISSTRQGTLFYRVLEIIAGKPEIVRRFSSQLSQLRRAEAA